MTMTAEIHKHPKTIASRLTEDLTEAIVRGEIPAGKKLSEPDLARRYEVSRGPLREALRRLEGRGLIRHIPHSGARVVTLEREEILELSRVREALEGMAFKHPPYGPSEAEVGYKSADYRDQTDWQRIMPAKAPNIQDLGYPSN